MRSRCQHRSTPAVGPRLLGPEDALAALRLSVGEVEGDLIAALLCDADHRLVVATTFEGAPATGAPDVARALVEAVRESEVRGAVLAIYRKAIYRKEGATLLGREEEAAVEECRAECHLGGIDLLDVLVVCGHRWRSLAETPPGWAGDAGP